MRIFFPFLAVLLAMSFSLQVEAQQESHEFILQLKGKYLNKTLKRTLRQTARKRSKRRPIKWIKSIQGEKIMTRLESKGRKRAMARIGYAFRETLPLENTFLVAKDRFKKVHNFENKIEYVEENIVIELTFPTIQGLPFARSGNPACSEFSNCANDPFTNWGVGPVVGIDAYEAWKTTTGNSDIVVAVIGSGIDLNHTDLTPNLWGDSSNSFTAGESVRGFNAFDNTLPQDDFGFSTHEAGVIGAKGNNSNGGQGVNWDVQLMSVKVYKLLSGNTLTTSLDAMIRGLGYIVKKKQEGNNIKVVQSSWLASPNSISLQQLIAQLNSLGVLFVTSGGDSGQNINNQVLVPATYDVPNVLTVGAYYGSFNSQSSFVQYSPFSNFGASKVHVAGPGEAIFSTWLGGGYQSWSGSNVGSAFAAGTAALIFSIDDQLTAGEVKDLIINNAKPFSEFDGFSVTGGAVNAGLAIQAIAPEPTLSGDYNCDNRVDAADYTVWRDNLGTLIGADACSGDGDGDGDVDDDDYQVWVANYGASL